MTMSIQKALMNNFNDIDANHDNFLTKDELEQYGKKPMDGKNDDAILAAQTLSSSQDIFDMAEVAQFHGQADGKLGYGDLNAVDQAVDQFNSSNGQQAQTPTQSGDSSVSDNDLSGLLQMMKNTVLGSIFSSLNETLNKASSFLGKIKPF